MDKAYVATVFAKRLIIIKTVEGIARLSIKCKAV